MVDDTAPGSGTPIVVTIFESYGAGAETIGPRVADTLRVPFHAQAFSSEAVEGVDVGGSDAEPVLAQVLSAMGSSTAMALGYGTNPGHDIHMAQRDAYDLAQGNTRTVLEQARAGGVIVGRNGAFILADRPSVLHVKLDAPVRERIRRAAESAGIDLEQAATRQKREDRLRAEMSLHFYGWDPRELDRYDLVVNTGTMDPDTCVGVIVAAARVKLAAA